MQHTAKHTQGQLKAEIWDYPLATPPRRDLVVVGEKYLLAVVAWDQKTPNPYTVPQEEAFANAHLFAAAPNMKTALVALLTEYASNIEAMAADAPRRALWAAAIEAIEATERGPL